MVKIATDINQSKLLTEILPLESADMYYDRYGTPSFIDKYVTHESIKSNKYQELIPCWSLTALLGVLKERNNCNALEMFTNKAQLYTITTSYYKDASWKNISIVSDNSVDACVDIILKLNELNLL